MRLTTRIGLVLGLFGLALGVIALNQHGLALQTSEVCWGERGVMPGEFVRPRASVIIDERLYVVDFTARIQAYELDGHHTGLTFTTPDYRNGRPSGLGVDQQGNLIVADSHYHTVRIYTADGTILRTLGGKAGSEPGAFGYISDCVQDSTGAYFVSEFGQNDRITKLDQQGAFVMCWGHNGTGPGEFQRVRALAIGPDGLLYAADACNHRVQVFTREGQFVKIIGGPGREPGQFEYPYDLAFGPDGSLFVVERGNCRVQKLTRDGVPLGSWGQPGRGPHQLADPWSISIDRFGYVHVIDTENHRVHRIKI